MPVSYGFSKLLSYSHVNFQSQYVGTWGHEMVFKSDAAQSVLGDERKDLGHAALISTVIQEALPFRVRAGEWGDYRLGLQEHVNCHRPLEPKGSPEWLNGRFKVT